MGTELDLDDVVAISQLAKRELDDLRAANRECMAHFDQMREERDALRAENERLRDCLRTANANHERFEREWYLRGDALERIRDMDRAPWDLMVYDMRGIAAEALGVLVNGEETMEHKHGWQGKTVRNIDGRTGVIAIEDGFGPWLDLHIDCEDGTKATVKLNARGRDSGETGWQWWCPEFADKPAWLPLGEQGAPLAYAETPNALLSRKAADTGGKNETT